jgi:predicted HTH transcriptional regulator
MLSTSKVIIKKLSPQLSAFANNSFGQMILGIEEIKNHGVLIGFKKKGFPDDELESINIEISNAMVNVDPAPRVTVNTLYEDNKVSNN